MLISFHSLFVTLPCHSAVPWKIAGEMEAEAKGAGRLPGALRSRPGVLEDSSFWSWIPTAHASPVLVD